MKKEVENNFFKITFISLIVLILSMMFSLLLVFSVFKNKTTTSIKDGGYFYDVEFSVANNRVDVLSENSKQKQELYKFEEGEINLTSKTLIELFENHYYDGLEINIKFEYGKMYINTFESRFLYNNLLAFNFKLNDVEISISNFDSEQSNIKDITIYTDFLYYGVNFSEVQGGNIMDYNGTIALYDFINDPMKIILNNNDFSIRKFESQKICKYFGILYDITSQVPEKVNYWDMIYSDITEI